MEKKKEQRTGSYSALTVKGLAEDLESTKESQGEAKGVGGSRV